MMDGGFAGGETGRLSRPGEPSGPFADWLPRAALAGLLGVTADTLARWESRRVGPPCVRIGRQSLYRVGAAQDWLLERERAKTGARP